MNKTITINISGAVFNIEEEAFQQLRRYIETLRTYFNESESSDEIVSDIESRIAELFQEKISESKQVITSEDVSDVIAVMGQPQDYLDAEEDDTDESNKAYNESSNRTSNRKIYRDPDEYILGGVCSGISHYLGWDPIILRLILVGSMIFAGTGLLLYIILWIIIPEAKTTSEKLRMKGQKVNVENIKNKVNEEMNQVKTTIENLTSSDPNKSGKGASARIKDSVESVGNGLGIMFSRIGWVLSKIIGVIFILIAICLAFVSLGTFIAADTILLTNNSLSFEQIEQMFYFGESVLTMAMIGISLMAFSIISGLLFTGVRFISGRQYRFRGVGFIMFVLFAGGLILTSISGVKIGKEFKSNAESKQEYILSELNSDTLHVNILEDTYFHNQIIRHDQEFMDMIKYDGDSIVLGEPIKLWFVNTNKPDFEIEIKKEGMGKTQLQAIERIENIGYDFSIKDSLAQFSPFLKIASKDNYRGQSVSIIIKVPEGKYVAMGEDLGRIYLFPHRSGKTFRMEEKGWVEME